MPPRPRGQTIVTLRGGRTTVAPAPQRSRSVASTPTVRAIANPRTLTRLLSEDGRRIAQLESKALADLFGSGVLLRNISVSTSIGYIQHRLGRPYTGYWPTRILTNGVTWKEVALPSNMSPSTWLALQFSASATIDLWVF